MSLLLLFHGAGSPPPPSDTFVGEAGGTLIVSTTVDVPTVGSLAGHTGAAAQHTVTVAGHKIMLSGSAGGTLQVATYKNIPGTMIPGSRSLLGVGI